MNNELYHYGVKGMRWGVRRKRESVIKARRKAGKAVRAYDKAAIYALGKKPAHASRSDVTKALHKKQKQLEDGWLPGTILNPKVIREGAAASQKAKVDYALSKKAELDIARAHVTDLKNARATERGKRAVSKILSN